MQFTNAALDYISKSCVFELSYLCTKAYFLCVIEDIDIQQKGLFFCYTERG